MTEQNKETALEAFIKAMAAMEDDEELVVWLPSTEEGEDDG